MDIKLDPDSVKVLVQSAILEQMGEEKREALLKDAIGNLLVVPAKTSYGTPTTTPLEDAFSSAVQMAARTVVMETVRNSPEVQEAINSILSPIIAEWANDNYDGLPEALGVAIGEWIKSKDRYYS